MDNRISTVRVQEYDTKLLVAAIGRHFDALGVWEDLRPDMRVVLKPNLLMRRAPDGATTTHPALVEAVGRVLRDRGFRDVTLADSPGGPYTKSLLEGVYKTCGMTDAAAAAGIRLNTDTGWREYGVEEAALCRSFNLITPIGQADYVINLPKLKTHAMTALSCGVKNLFGCVPGLQKPELHLRFPDKRAFGRMLVDLSLLVRPGVTVADAIVSMEGDGPSGGKPRHTGMTFAARSPHVLDLGICEFIGLSPGQVSTVTHSAEAGLCPDQPEKLEWLCDGKPEPILDFKHPASKSLAFINHLPAFMSRPVGWVEERFLSPRPGVRGADCIGCGKCAESCAPGAMVIRDGKAVLELSKCIRCFCCHEMCPVGAINIHRARLFGL